jgi:hypothetical protein
LLIADQRLRCDDGDAIKELAHDSDQAGYMEGNLDDRPSTTKEKTRQRRAFIQGPERARGYCCCNPRPVAISATLALIALPASMALE